MPWRFTTIPPTSLLTTVTSTTKDNLEDILQAIDTTSYKINNGSLSSSSLNDTEVVVVENGSESFRIIDDEHVIQQNNETTAPGESVTVNYFKMLKTL